MTGSNSCLLILGEAEIKDRIISIQVDDCAKVTVLSQNSESFITSEILPLGPACAQVVYRKTLPWEDRIHLPGGLTIFSTTWDLKNGYNLHGSSECPEEYSASLVLQKNGSVTVMYDRNLSVGHTLSCMMPSTTLRFHKLDPEDKSTPLLPFLKKSPTGDLALYKLDTSQQTWVVDSVLVLGSVCKSLLACGPYNICDLNGECNPTLAIGNTTDGPRNLLSWENSLNWSRRGVGCHSITFMDSASISLESCRSGDSLSSFYDHSTGKCYMMYDYPQGSMHRDDNMTAFINFDVTIDTSWNDGDDGEITLFFALLGAGAVIGSIHLVHTISAILFLPIVQSKLSYKLNPVREVESLLSTMQGLPQRFSYMELEAATRGFASKLGAGGFGSVYEGFLGKDVQHVAVKKLDDNGTESAKQFVAELSGIGGVSHYNIVKLCGFCIEGASKKLLVYEFMPNGSLDRWLFAKDSKMILSWEQRFNIALGTARGLFYLHEECSEPILHLDIKPQNILLDGKFEAKVADFGMAKMLANRDVTRVETHARGTPGYMAPEWLLQYAATKKCDVYSYGMLLLELIGGRKNIDLAKVNNEDSSWYFPAWVVDRAKENDLLKVVDAKMRGSNSNGDVEMMLKVALWCIQENPMVRPSMGMILQMLQKQRTVGEPPMSFYFDHTDMHNNSNGVTNQSSSLPLLDYNKA